jgi:signal transduction histidine kinase
VFTDEDERVVLLLAGMAAVAIENSRLYHDSKVQTERARHSAEARASLLGAAAAVLNEPDALEALRLVAREAVRLLRVRLVAVAIPDEFAGVIRYEVTEGLAAETFDTSAVPLVDSFAGSVMLAGVAIHVDGRETSAIGAFASAGRLDGHDVIAQPVLVADEPAAVLLAADRDDGESFDPDDEELLAVLATFAAIAIRTARWLARERSRAEALARLRQTQADAESEREALARVVETQERERRRIAQDLHDRTAGGLTSVLFSLRRIERHVDEAQREQLAEARAGVAAAIEDVRDLIADLRPKVLDDFGLGPALERLCETMTRRSGLVVRPELGEGLDGLPPDVATATYRIVQEALANVVRHAGASTAVVNAAIVEGRLVVSVEDDGCGFGPGTLGYGIEGMIERARMVAGRVDLESSEGGGGRVRFETRALTS